MSRYALFIHIVWTTKQRQPYLTPEKEARLFRLAISLTEEMGYEVLAINGMPDHVHLLISSGPQMDLIALMKKIKGITSAMLNDMTDHESNFRWQEGYYAATVTPSHLPKVLAYVQGQKEHHRAGKTYAVWEGAEGEAEPAASGC